MISAPTTITILNIYRSNKKSRVLNRLISDSLQEAVGIKKELPAIARQLFVNIWLTKFINSY
jgi:hypothetical protein